MLNARYDAEFAEQGTPGSRASGAMGPLPLPLISDYRSAMAEHQDKPSTWGPFPPFPPRYILGSKVEPLSLFLPLPSLRLLFTHLPPRLSLSAHSVS